MRKRRNRPTSLAASVVLLTFVLTMLAVTIVSLSALVGVYDLAQRQVSARHQAYLQALIGDITLRLDAAGRLVKRSLVVGINPSTGEIDRGALAAQYETGIEHADQLLLVRRDGSVVSGYPAFRTPRSMADNPLVSAAATDAPTFYYERVEGQVDARLWVAQAAEADPDLVVMVLVRSSFLHRAVDLFADSSIGRWVLLAERDGPVIVMSVGASQLVDDSVIFESSADDSHSGTVSGITEDETVVWGRFEDLDGYRGLPWRALIMEPRNVIVRATIGALTPAVLALFAAGIITLVIVAVFARRLVAPLTHLEERAREAVTGAYVRPLPTDRTDEVGRLAVAFNAIALRLNALHDLSQLLASSSKLDQVLDGIISAMGHIVQDASVAVLLVDEHSGTLTLARGRDLGVRDDHPVPPEAGSWLADAMRSEDLLVRTVDGREISALVPGEYSEQVTMLTAPLVVGTDQLGVVVVIEDGTRTFSEAETEMVRTFSAQAAVGVHNSRLFEIETRSRAEAEALRTVAEQLSRPQELAVAIEGIEATIAALLGASSSLLAVFDRPRFGLPPSLHAPAESELQAAWRGCASEHEPICVIDRTAHHPDAHTLLDATGSTHALLATVIIDSEPCGVLAFFRPDGSAFSKREHRLAAALASQLALALESASNLEKARARAVNLETIFRISQAVSSSLQTKVVLNRVLDVVQKIFAADAVSLMTHDAVSGRVVTEMARGMISSEMLHFSTEPGEDVPGVVFAKGDPLSVPQISSDSNGVAALAAEQGLHSLLSVPLRARGRSIGVLTVFSTEHDAFSREDSSLLHTFASQAALAIDTAKMYGREHLVATVLQASILPRELPALAHIESSSVYLPAGEEADIGGDYYDLFRAPDGSAFVVIGDVCGKGVVAATKTSRIKYMVRGLAAAGLNPAQIMSEVNRMVSDTGDTSDIVTLWIGLVDVGSGTLTYANGGHPPALLRRAHTNDIARCAPTGPLLGATAAAHYDLETAPMGPSDVLLLYTDGVTEARRGNTFFGEGRVRRALRRGADVDAVTQGLMSSLDRFAHGVIRDDAAVLAVMITQDEQMAEEE
ncbi:MAG: SpoIIE family protein phosphatase [Coriobacteriia bacterium]|jgi:GAF domain-containing protein|nr:SpoIIE family protein phosphatase [Coriobacteriia bacterium]